MVTEGLSAAVLRVLRALVDSPRPMTVAALAVTLGGHPNTMRLHLKALLVDGRVAEVPLTPHVSADVAPIDPGWDGATILSAISRGDISAGPLSELHAITLEADGGDPVLTVSPQPWMANPLGAIQGGVMASIVGQACSMAGQNHTGPGDRHTVADLSVFYFRSPPADRGALTLATTTERVGRRLATVSATMTDSIGTLYARAVANIAYDRARAF